MGYTCTYKSELGEILLAADEIGLTGLWFTGQKYFASTLPDEHISRETPVLSEAKEWLACIFGKSRPSPRLHPAGQSSGRQYGRFYCRFHTADHNLRGIVRQLAAVKGLPVWPRRQ
ncbi:MAG: hypothetical protein ACLRTA_08815 [Clostridia bacterium]